MDEEGSIGSEDETVKLKEESKSMEEAIKEGIQKASEVSVQSHEESVPIRPCVKRNSIHLRRKFYVIPFPASKSMEIMHPTEFFRLEGC